MFEKVSNHVSRLICPIQSTGQVGKSTVLSSIIEYYKATEISFKAIDADGEHKTLSTWYKDIQSIPFKEKDDIITLIEELGNEKVQLIDFPAQATSELLSSFVDYDIISYLADRGIRMTVVLFANQDQAGLVAAADIFGTLGRTVDYLVVENPVKFSSLGFWKSSLGKTFANDLRLELPALHDKIIHKINMESKNQGKVLNFIESADFLEGLDRTVVNIWKKEVFEALHRAARILLPVGHGVVEPGSATKPFQRANPLDLY